MNEYNKIGYSKDGIIVIHDAVDTKDLEKLNNFLENINRFAPIGQWEIENKDILDLLIKYQEKTFNYVEENYIKKFNVPIKKQPENPLHLVKWELNEGFKPHSDSETLSRKPAIQGGFYRYNITTIYYLTDQHIGGRIYFPDFDDYEPKIKAGTLVMFPSRYTHAIHPKVSGIRNTMPSWWTFDVEDDYNKSDHNYDGDISSVLFTED